MYQGTTPTIVLRVAGVNLDGATCYVTIEYGNKKQLTKSGDELVVSGNQIAMHLSQEETLQLPAGKWDIQVRWIDSEDNSMATDKAKISVSEVLLKQIIAYQGGEGE